MIAFTPEASAQVDALERFYIDKDRPQAIRNLAHAIAEAAFIIVNAPERGIMAPRPYPDLAALGCHGSSGAGTGLPTIPRCQSLQGCTSKRTTSQAAS